jgi:hypothetical protein
MLRRPKPSMKKEEEEEESSLICGGGHDQILCYPGLSCLGNPRVFLIQYLDR